MEKERNVGDNPATASERTMLDFFSGGIPAGALLEFSLGGLRALGVGKPPDTTGRILLLEISFVGALSYFEAFCRDQFGALINIYPRLHKRLSKGGIDISADSSKLLELPGQVEDKIGFFVAEKLDFGKAQKINSMFFHLLSITPFSKGEATRFADFLRVRNLIVHHGGIYTSDYLRQEAGKVLSPEAVPFYFSKTIKEQDLLDLLDFLQNVAAKILNASQKALAAVLKEDGVTLEVFEPTLSN